ncbi:MAG TPA: hypothetical protein VF613_17455 [Longimicrobium sp.]|jgi:hypothetical protein
MDLHVTFKGLCLFVPDPNGKLMHVLLPATKGSGGHVHAHDAKLHYKGARESLHGRVLDLSMAGGTGAKIDVGENAFPAGMLIGKAIDSKQWDLCPRESVAARITLPRAGTVKPGKPIKFRVEEGSDIRRFRLTNEVTWIVPGVNIDPKTWVLNPLCPASGPRPHPLGELTGKEVKLRIEHLPTRPGNKPEIGAPAEHVEVYYTLFREPMKGPIPILEELPLLPPLGATPFNCMVGVAPGEP